MTGKRLGQPRTAHNPVIFEKMRQKIATDLNVSG